MSLLAYIQPRKAQPGTDSMRLALHLGPALCEISKKVLGVCTCLPVEPLVLFVSMNCFPYHVQGTGGA